MRSTLAGETQPPGITDTTSARPIITKVASRKTLTDERYIAEIPHTQCQTCSSNRAKMGRAASYSGSSDDSCGKAVTVSGRLPPGNLAYLPLAGGPGGRANHGLEADA